MLNQIIRHAQRNALRSHVDHVSYGAAMRDKIMSQDLIIKAIYSNVSVVVIDRKADMHNTFFNRPIVRNARVGKHA